MKITFPLITFIMLSVILVTLAYGFYVLWEHHQIMLNAILKGNSTQVESNIETSKSAFNIEDYLNITR